MKVTIYSSDSTVLYAISVSEDSMMVNEIRGEHTLTLYFSLPEFIEIPEGSYVNFEGEKFILLSSQKVSMIHTRDYDYTVELQSSSALLNDYIIKNPEDGRLTFPYTAKAEEHLSLIVSNLNRDGGSGWSIGECVTDGSTKYLQYNYVNCRDALDSIADLYGTEWEIKDKVISLHKVEYNVDSPLDIEYGQGNGLKQGIIRDTVQRPLTRLYTQGGSTNIDPSDYGSQILLLPKSVTFRYDGNKFEDEDGFDSTHARSYTTDAKGTYISSVMNSGIRVNEGVIDCSDIYPNAEHEVVEYDSDDISVVLNVPESLNYSQYQILGKLPTITFQSGELTGRTFEIARDENGPLDSDKVYSDDDTFVGWRFKLKQSYSDGRVIPDASVGLVPSVGDKCRIFGVKMPSHYISDNENKSGASWDMLRRGIAYLYENEQYIYSLKVEIDPIWAKNNWSAVSGKIVLGGYVRYSNSGWAEDGIVMRIQSIRQNVSNPYSMEIELGNGIVGGGVLKGLRDSISMQSGSISDQSAGLSSLEYDVSTQNTRYVTVSTYQEIWGEKHFNADVIFGGNGSKMFVPSTAGAGLYYMYFDVTSAVNGETPTASGGLDVDELWAELGGSSSNKVIDISHIPHIPTSDISNYLFLNPNNGVLANQNDAVPANGRFAIYDVNMATTAGGNDGYIMAFRWPYGNWATQVYLDADPTGVMALRHRNSSNVWTDWHRIWHSGNDGSGSGLDADLLDGYQANEFMRSFWTGEPGYSGSAYAADPFVTFSYSNSAPYTGALAHIAVRGYGFYLNTSYYSNTRLAFRRFGTTGDGGMGPWYNLLDEGHDIYTSGKLYVPSSQGNQVFDIYIQ